MNFIGPQTRKKLGKLECDLNNRYYKIINF